VLESVGETLSDDEVRRRHDCLRERPCGDIDSDRDRTVGGERAHRRIQPVVEALGSDAVRETA
jgi:hypothetical protein